MRVAWTRVALAFALAVGSSCAAGRRGPASTAGVGAALHDDSVFPAREEALREELDREPPAMPRGLGGPVILVTIDGTRWQDIFDGTDPALSGSPKRPPREIIPHLDRIIRERGAALGAPGLGVIRATGPSFVSLPGYTEILTGRAPIGCQDNSCKQIETPTFLDDAHTAGASVAAFGSWEMLDRVISARPGSFPVSCGRNGDESIDPWPGHGGFRPDRVTAALALRYLEENRPDVLYIGLGEPDEYGHRGDYAGYLRSLTYADGVVARIASALDRMGSRGARTHVFVTADHGRAHDFNHHGGFAPESSRVWLVATGPSIEARGFVLSSHERHLADIAPTLRILLGLTPDRERHHDRDRGWRGDVLDELLARGCAPFGSACRVSHSALTTPTGQETPVPPSPQ